jgi:hypothetical protein
MMDTTAVTALNVTRAADAPGIFKPFAHRLSSEPELISDSDEEIIVSQVPLKRFINSPALFFLNALSVFNGRVVQNDTPR